MKNKFIGLDIDGVCANWGGLVASFFKLKNVPVKPAGLYSYFEEPRMREELNAIMEQDWFWGNIDPYPWATDLVNLANEFGDVYFLTKGMPNGFCFGGKMEWINKYFPEMTDKTIIITQDKWVCSKEGRILIDDDIRHKKGWENEGGQFYWWEEVSNSQAGVELIPEKLDNLREFLENNYEAI